MCCAALWQSGCASVPSRSHFAASEYPKPLPSYLQSIPGCSSSSVVCKHLETSQGHRALLEEKAQALTAQLSLRGRNGVEPTLPLSLELQSSGHSADSLFRRPKTPASASSWGNLGQLHSRQIRDGRDYAWQSISLVLWLRGMTNLPSRSKSHSTELQLKL